jgi:phospholipid/cholesterol/gamma-HCH transport system ATP-binding protein
MQEQNIRERVIQIKDVHKSFGDLHILRGVSIELFFGENVVVLGRSGTGKSVLIKIISGLLYPDSGVVNVLGRSVPDLNRKELNELRREIGFSFQNSALYDSMTVRGNLEFPLIRNVKNLTQKEIDASVEKVLESVGLMSKIDQMPSELSGGQRKRIGIARTLIMNPKVMLYDEPTAGLDPITCNEINQLMNSVKEEYNTSSIIITHDLTCAKDTGDRISMLLDGTFTPAMTFDELFATHEERIQEFYDYNFIK